MQNLSEERMRGLLELLHQYSQFRTDVINLLNEGSSYLKAISGSVEETIKRFEVDREQRSISTDTGMLLHKNEPVYVHVNNDAQAPSDLITKVYLIVAYNLYSGLCSTVAILLHSR